MDALIRSAQLAPARTRLHTGRVQGEQMTSRAGTDKVSRAPEEILREEIEQRVRAQLSAQLQDLYEAERQRGQADGYAAGLAAAGEAATKGLESARGELLEQVDRALTALADAHQAALAQLQANVGEVAFAAVCRLLGRQAPTQALVLTVVEQTCARLRTDSNAILRLHPRDIRTLNELLHDGELRLKSLSLRLVPDESLRLGGCVVEAASGQYDGGLESQLRRLHAVLTGGSETGVQGCLQGCQGHPIGLTSAAER